MLGLQNLRSVTHAGRCRKSAEPSEYSYTDTAVNERRLQDCVDVLLTMQNKNGGFASYELVRGGDYMEYLNCAEVFGASVCPFRGCRAHGDQSGNIMIEYNYPECTTSALSALMHFSHEYPNYRKQEIKWVAGPNG